MIRLLSAARTVLRRLARRDGNLLMWLALSAVPLFLAMDASKALTASNQAQLQTVFTKLANQLNATRVSK